MRASSLKLRYVWGGAVTYPPGATFGPRKLDDFEMVWIVAGNVLYHAQGRDYPAPPGTMILARPGFHDSFTWDPDRPTRHAYFHYQATSTPSDWPAVDDWPITRLMPHDDVVRPLFRYVLRYCRSRTSGQGSRVEPMAARAVETLVGAFVTGPVSQASEHDREYPEAVSKALRFMQASLASDAARVVTLDAVAKAASVSPEHLCRLFRSTFDTGPIEALRLLRLDTAVLMLARSNLNVEQIAWRTGFASPYHFSRRFRSEYGLPPTELRKRLAAGHAPPINRLLRYMPEMRDET